MWRITSSSFRDLCKHCSCVYWCWMLKRCLHTLSFISFSKSSNRCIVYVLVRCIHCEDCVWILLSFLLVCMQRLIFTLTIIITLHHCLIYIIIFTLVCNCILLAFKISVTSLICCSFICPIVDVTMLHWLNYCEWLNTFSCLHTVYLSPCLSLK